MTYRIFAELIVIVHFTFVLFVIFGGLLVLWRKKWAFAHVPAVLWGALIEFFGWICPLTPLEKWLRIQSGSVGYERGFVEHYILPVLYPDGLTRGIQIGLGLFVLGFNLMVYGFVIHRFFKNKGE
jgi:hypothetical protein